MEISQVTLFLNINGISHNKYVYIIAYWLARYQLST